MNLIIILQIVLKQANIDQSVMLALSLFMIELDTTAEELCNDLYGDNSLSYQQCYNLFKSIK